MHMKNDITTKSGNQPKEPHKGSHPKQDRSLYPNDKGFTPKHSATVGEVILGRGDIEYNAYKEVVRIEVVNTGDRPIQVGSHFHFFEVNRYLEFDRNAAFGCHLNIPATTAIRFEPGDKREVELVAFGGKRRIIGFNNLVMGYAGTEDAPTYYPVHAHALRKIRHTGFKTSCKDSACDTHHKERSCKSAEKSNN